MKEILQEIVTSHRLLFEGYPSSFWEVCAEHKDFEWGDEWSWRREDGEIVDLKLTFDSSAGRVSFDLTSFPVETLPRVLIALSDVLI